MTNSPPGKLDDDDRGSWLRTLYQIAHSDTRWAKEQSWRVVYWSLLLFAALLAIFKYLVHGVADGFFIGITFIGITIAIPVMAYLSLLDLHRSAGGTRRTTDKIQKDEIKELSSRFLDPRQTDLEHYLYLIMQVVVLVVAAALTILALPYVSQQ